MELDGEMGAGIRVGSLEITPAILSLIAALDEFKGAWRAIGRIAPERLSALRRVATIESIGSSTRIEGAALNDREVERLLANLDVRAFASRDESVRLLDLSREHGRLTVAMAVELTGANRNTVKDHLNRLTRAGRLARHGAGRGTWYSLA